MRLHRHHGHTVLGRLTERGEDPCFANSHYWWAYRRRMWSGRGVRLKESGPILQKILKANADSAGRNNCLGGGVWIRPASASVPPAFLSRPLVRAVARPRCAPKPMWTICASLHRGRHRWPVPRRQSARDSVESQKCSSALSEMLMLWFCDFPSALCCFGTATEGRLLTVRLRERFWRGYRFPAYNRVGDHTL